MFLVARLETILGFGSFFRGCAISAGGVRWPLNLTHLVLQFFVPEYVLRQTYQDSFVTLEISLVDTLYSPLREKLKILVRNLHESHIIEDRPFTFRDLLLLHKSHETLRGEVRVLDFKLIADFLLVALRRSLEQLFYILVVIGVDLLPQKFIVLLDKIVSVEDQ